MSNDLIPVNLKGKPTDLEFSVACPTTDQARHCYLRAVKRMQNPGIWHELVGWASASFDLLAVLSLRYKALKVLIIIRMVSYQHLQVLDGRVHGWAFRNGPAFQHAFYLKPKVVVQV
jgi:hypothetical protein